MKPSATQYLVITIEVEALPARQSEGHVKRLIHGNFPGLGRAGIIDTMGIADRKNVKFTFFLDVLEEVIYPKEIEAVATWLTLKSDTGKATGLTIEAIAVHDYFSAISLEGNRDDPRAFNSGTTIRRNTFRNIGSIAIRGEGVSFAAVLFYNSKDNLVENNFFGTIRNKRDKDCGSLHSIYIAHFSSGNRIVDNTFEDVCGSVIKLRDRSNDNLIEGNRFKAIQQAPAVEEWFCDAGARKDCTKALGECPSTGNVVRNNDLSGSPGTEYVSIVGDRMLRNWCSPEDFSRERVQSK